MKEKIFKLPTNKIIDPSKEYFTNKASIDWNSEGRKRVIDICKEKYGVIDVGAHVGITTVHWLVAGFQQVHSFEINPSHFDCLVENTIEFKEKISYYPYGCGKENKTTVAGYRTPKNSGSFQVIDDHAIKNWDIKNTFPVEIKLLDDHEFEKISLIKIDVEGWELEVLQGSLNTISKHQPIMFIEYGHGNHKKTHHKYDDAVFQKLIKDLKYRELEVMGADAGGCGDSIFVPEFF
jgi:FkbM family methyltransferase